MAGKNGGARKGAGRPKGSTTRPQLADSSEEGITAFVTSLDRTQPDAIYASQVKVRVEAVELLRLGFAQLATIASGKSGVQSQQNEAR